MTNRTIFPRFFTAFLAGLGSVLISSGTAHGQIKNPVTGDLGNDPTAASDGSLFASYFVHIWNVLIQLGALAVLIYFLWGAFEWITASGDSGKLASARNRMLQAAIGLLILIGSFVIISFLGQLFFGDSFDILELTFPTPGS